MTSRRRFGSALRSQSALGAPAWGARGLFFDFGLGRRDLDRPQQETRNVVAEPNDWRVVLFMAAMRAVAAGRLPPRRSGPLTRLLRPRFMARVRLVPGLRFAAPARFMMRVRFLASPLTRLLRARFMARARLMSGLRFAMRPRFLGLACFLAFARLLPRRVLAVGTPA